MYEKFQSLLDKTNKTPYQVSKDTGISTATLSSWKNGVYVPKADKLMIDEYRKYRKLLPNTDKWWWTLTPCSTSCNDDSRWIAVVSPSGDFSSDIYYVSHGVRPVCIFSSSIFESEEDDE